MSQCHEDAPATNICPICLEPITRAAGTYVSRCQPIPHKMHMRCWNKQNKCQRSRCCVCRQQNVDDLTFHAVVELCGIKKKKPTMRQLTPCGKSLLKNFQIDTVSRKELWSFILWMRQDGDRPSDEVLARIMEEPDQENSSSSARNV